MKMKQRKHSMCAVCKKCVAILILGGFICGCGTSGHAYKADIDKRTVKKKKNTVDIDKRTVQLDENTVDVIDE